MLDSNKDECIEFLVMNNFSLAFMTRHKWKQNSRGDHMYGKVTGNYLINTNGIAIEADPCQIFICHWNEDGEDTGP